MGGIVRAMVLEKQANISSRPLVLKDIVAPEPKGGDVCVKVSACGLCHTDLHVIEGDLPPLKMPLVPGHQIVGTVSSLGPGVTGIKLGDRVGITWMNSTCGKCQFCIKGMENLCDNIVFTGYGCDGGYSEYAKVSHQLAYKIPDRFDDSQAAPMLCAGIVGYRALRLCALRKDSTLAIFGFGASAHITAQVAKHKGIDTIVFTRNPEHRKAATDLGAKWVGSPQDTPPTKADAAIIFAPAGELVPKALETVGRGGTVVIADIYMSTIPALDYTKHIYYERSVTSVANYTRNDANDFLGIADEIPIRPTVQRFGLEEANAALAKLKDGKINGAAVLQIS